MFKLVTAFNIIDIGKINPRQRRQKLDGSTASVPGRQVIETVRNRISFSGIDCQISNDEINYYLNSILDRSEL